MHLMESMASGAELLSWFTLLLLFAQIAEVIGLLVKFVQWLSLLMGLLLHSDDEERRLEAARSVTRTAGRGERLEVIEQWPWLLTASSTAAEETVYVAVGRDVKESSATVAWAVKNRVGRKIGILHVHQPSSTLPSSKLHSVTPMRVESYPKKEGKNVHEILSEYRRICVKRGVESEKISTDFIEMEDIERGILKLVAEHGVTMLVMGAAADKHYSKKMKQPTSKKAYVVSKGAPLSCYIWFICDGKLVFAREFGVDGNAVYVTPPPAPVTQTRCNNLSPILPRSIALGTNDDQIQPPCRDDVTLSSSDETSSFMSDSLSDISMFSTESEIGETARTAIARNQESNQRQALSQVDEHEDIFGISEMEKQAKAAYYNELQKRKEIEEMLDQAEEAYHNELEKRTAMEKLLDQAEAAYHNGLEKKKEVEEMLDQAEAAYWKEMEKRKELEEMLDEAETTYHNELEKRKELLNEAEAAYHNELEKKKEMEEMLDQAEAAYRKEMEKRKEMEEILNQAETTYHNELQKKKELLKEAEAAYQNELQKRKEIKKLLDQAVTAYHSELEKRKEMEEMQVQESYKLKKVLEELQDARDQHQQAALDQSVVSDSSQISYSEIEEATQGLHKSFKIGEGGYGSVYRGLLRCTPVAIKMLNPASRQGGSEFEQEMEILTRVRHPNMVILMGTCREAKALIYEYLSNGSLEDCLLCKNNSPSLSWQIRIRILSQVRAALIFLHSAGRHGIVHGDLKPDNILLDANLVAKLGDFGISRLMRREAGGTSPSAGSTATICWETEQPKGTFPYIDPVYVQTGVLRPKSDVYSFGVVILRVITGLPAKEIAKLMNDGVQGGQLCHIRDKTAGKWPPLLAKELARLALTCCKMNPKERPDLKSEVWKVLESMMAAARPAAPSPIGAS